MKQLAESFYVDDFTSGVYSEEEGFKLYQRAKEICKLEVSIFEYGEPIPYSCSKELLKQNKEF